MDLQNPLRSIAPTVEADVLAVLARTHRPMTGAAVERLAERSHAQVRAVLRRLASTGLVEADRVGNAVQYVLNRDHVLVPAIDELLAAASVVERGLRELAGECEPAPASIVLFGSFARRSGGPESDVDLLLVRPSGVHPDDRAWGEVRLDLAQHVESWTGNRCQVVEVTRTELRTGAARKEPLVASLVADGRDVFGAPLEALLGGRARRNGNSRGE